MHGSTCFKKYVAVCSSTLQNSSVTLKLPLRAFSVVTAPHPPICLPLTCFSRPTVLDFPKCQIHEIINMELSRPGCFHLFKSIHIITIVPHPC